MNLLLCCAGTTEKELRRRIGTDEGNLGGRFAAWQTRVSSKGEKRGEKEYGGLGIVVLQSKP